MTRFSDFPELPFSEDFIPLLPEVPCIYMAMSDEDDIIYIGQTTRKDRLKKHHKLEYFYKCNVVKIKYQICDRKNLDRSETIYINAHRPILNIRKKRTIEALEQQRKKDERRAEKAQELLQKAQKLLTPYDKIAVLSNDELKIIKKLIGDKAKMMQADNEEYNRICGMESHVDYSYMMDDLKSLADNLNLTDKDLFGNYFG